MNVNEDETEIKIEYYETFIADPLSDNNDHPKPIRNSENVGLRKTCKEVLLENSTNYPTGVPDTDQNNVDETEIGTQWYKLVNTHGRYVCTFCELSYTTVQTLRNHVRTKHSEKYGHLKIKTRTSLRKKKLKCHLCSKKFILILDLQKHIQTHGLNNIRNSCTICHATFDEEWAMLDHVATEHKIVKKTKHFCIICGYSTSKISHYKQHENTHKHGDKRKCPNCDYSTNYPTNLRVHEKIHSDVKPYVCDYKECGYRCASKSALKSHQLKHDKKKYMLYCDKCSYSTVYKNSLNKHIDSHSRNSVRKR